MRHTEFTAEEDIDLKRISMRQLQLNHTDFLPNWQWTIIKVAFIILIVSKQRHVNVYKYHRYQVS